jgi:Nucleoporin complex subunit 54
LFAPFGQQPQQQQQPQIPAQAALHAHQEAMNRAETEKIKAELSKLYAIYAGAITPSTSSDSKTNFVSIVYNDLTPEHRQLQWLHGIGAGGQIMPIAPPQPPQVSEEEWNKAVVQNPDPMSYMPVPMVGADSLSARVSWQHERAKQLAKDAESIQASHETVKDLFAQGQKRLEEIRRAHSNHRKRLLNVMRKVEVVRCMNQSLQPDEVRVMEELRKLEHETQRARSYVAELEIRSRSARPQQHAAAAATLAASIPDRERLAKVLHEHREELKKVSQTLSKDVRDLDLMTERVIVPQLGGPPRGSR